jgi:hypothetical protein
MRESTMKKKWLWIAPLAVVGLVAFVAIGGAVVRLLWNWLMPELFGWREITFWQALGLLALCRILFGGLGGGHSRSGLRRRRDVRLDRLSPEERERFHEKLRERWGAEARPGASEG